MELAVSDFDYSILDIETKSFLEERANIIYGIQSKSAYDIGKQLSQAQEKLARNRYGCFEEWYTSLGFKKTKAYEYINHYNFIRSQSEQLNIDKFKKMPKKLQAEMSKPSANPEVNQAVFDGDITTHKKYKEMERKLKLAESDLSRARETADKYAERVITLKAQQPQTITKEVVKEVIPDDYKATKQLNNTLLDKNKDLQRQYDDVKSRNDFVEKQLKDLYAKRAEVDEKSAKYDELTRAIEQSQGQLDEYQKSISAYKDILSFLKKGNQFLSNFGGLVYVDIKPALSNYQIKNELETFSTMLNSLAREVDNLLNEDDILEGEIL